MSKAKVLLILLGTVICVYALPAQPNHLPATFTGTTGFIQNKGQIFDQNNQPNPEVRYLLPLARGLNVQLRRDGFSYDTYRKDANSECLSLHRVDIDFLFANVHSEIVAEKAAEGLLHFPSLGIADVQQFQKITYRNIYPQIDLEFLASASAGKPMEYNFILHPGACMSDIQLAYSGMESLALGKEQLNLQLEAGTLKEEIPASFWAVSGEAVPVDYQILVQAADQTIIGFSAPVAEIRETLVIDPIPHLDWGTYQGGSGDDSSRDLVLDDAGNAYIVGASNSMNAIATSGTHQTTLAGGFDVFVAKFDNDGQRQWGTYWGGTEQEFGQNIDLDPQGNVYITGATSSTVGVVTAGAAQETYGGGGNDGFVAKFDPDGILQWASYLGGPADEFSNALVADQAGNVFISGWTNSDSGISTPGAHQTNFGNSQDVFLSKYDTDGNLQWSTYYGDSGLDIGLQLEIDLMGNVLLSGWTSSTVNIATPGTHQDTYGGGSADAFMALFSTDGVRQWATYYGGTGNDYGDALRLDAAGNIFLGGPCSSTDAMVTAGTHQSVHQGGFDAFLAKFDPTGIRQWGTYYGGIQDETAYGIAIGTDGGIYLTGYTNSDTDIATADAHQTEFAGGDWDGYWVKFDANGLREMATYYGGALSDQAYGIGVDGSDQVFLAGVSGSDQGISTTDIHQPIFGGGASDAFLARFSPCNEPVLHVPNGAYLCANDTFTLELNFSEAGPYTFVYSIDGVDQNPITTSDTVYNLMITPEQYQDSVIITEVSSGACPGTVTGLPFVYVLEPLSHTNEVIDCDDNSQTYTVSFQLSGGFLTYFPVSPTTGTVNGNTFTSTALPFGQDYTLQITDGMECDTLTVAGSPSCNASCPSFNLNLSSNSPICEGEDILLMAEDGAVNYTWSGPANFSSTEQNPTITNVSAAFSGTYQLTVDDGNACSETYTVDVLVNRMPTITSLDAPPLSCAENMTTLTVEASGTGVLEYSLDGVNYSTQNTFPDLTAGNYDIYVRDELGCVNQSALTLQTANGPVITSLGVTQPDCGETNGTINIIADGQELPLEYSINDGGTFQPGNTFENLPAGSYPVIVRDQAGCVISAWATLAGGGEPPVIDEVLIEQAACIVDQNSITINAISSSNQLSYSINGVDFQSSNRFSNLLPGNYSVSVEDENGCSVTEIVNIPPINVLAIDEVISQAADCRGNTGRAEVVARGGSGLLTYQLDTLVQTTPEFEGLAPGNYLLTVTDDSGCSQTQQINITRGDCPIYIANAFSPNGDGINDRFAIYGAAGIDGQVVTYQIFNRWGNQVYQASGFALGDMDRWWDGNFQGRPVAAGMYIFHLVIELSGGEQIVEQGEVNVVR